METFKREFDRVKTAATFGDLEANAVNSFQWDDFKTKHARKAFAIGIVLVILNACVSNEFTARHFAIAVVGYTDGLEMGKFIGSIIALAGACAGMQLVDRIGRKVKQCVAHIK